MYISSTGAKGGQKKELGSLELELQVFVITLCWCWELRMVFCQGNVCSCCFLGRIPLYTDWLQTKVSKIQPG